MYDSAEFDKSGLLSDYCHTFLCKFFSFLNACISVKTSLINTKFFGNLGVLFLTMGINSC